MRPGQIEIGTKLHQLLSLPFAACWQRSAGGDAVDPANRLVAGELAEAA
jgi:hypothetical protein